MSLYTPRKAHVGKTAAVKDASYGVSQLGMPATGQQLRVFRHEQLKEQCCSQGLDGRPYDGVQQAQLAAECNSAGKL